MRIHRITFSGDPISLYRLKLIGLSQKKVGKLCMHEALMDGPAKKLYGSSLDASLPYRDLANVGITG